MCRLLGYVDPTNGAVGPWLLESARSLLAQSDHSPDQLQDDGWGIAWYPAAATDPVIRKGVRGAFRKEERSAFTAAAREARGPVVVGHLRHASNPLQLPREQLIAIENSQPFSFNGSVFAHNGAIAQPTEVRDRLGPLTNRVQGVNDSEVLFWLLTRREQELEDPVRAYASAVGDLWAVWEQRGRPASGPYGGLNILWTRGPDELFGFCHWRGDHGGGLFATDRPYYEMTYRKVGNAVVVGSEPFDDRVEGWEAIPNGTYIHVQVTDGHVNLRTGIIPLEVEAVST